MCDFRSTIRYNPTPKVSKLNSYVQNATALSEQHVQQSSSGYVVTSAGRHDAQKSSSYSNTDDYEAKSQIPSQAPPYSLFSRDDALPGMHATSMPGSGPSPQSNDPRLNTRSDSNERKSSVRQTEYRGRGGADPVSQYVARRPLATWQSPTSNNTRTVPETGNFETRQGSRSLLSRLGQEFTKIAIGDYLECEEFMTANPAIFKEDPNQLVQEAVRFAKEGKSAPARACVQQSLLLRKCSKMSDTDSRSFFAQMGANDRKTLGDFLKDFDKIIDAVMSSAATVVTAKPLSEQAMKKIHESKPLLIDERDSLRPPLESRHAPNPTGRRNSVDHISAPLENLAINNRHSQVSNHGKNLVTMGPPAASNQNNRNRRPTISSEESAVDNLSIVPDIRGSDDRDDQEEELDPRYYKRPDAKKFFVQGRVFALLWHESAGESSPGDDLSTAIHSTKGKHGERIFSHIRRMAVVREGHGYCVCVSINTYRGQGVLKRGFTKADRHAHAIVYSSDTNPACKAAEKGLMNKKPIEVNMASAEQKLDSMSRIHFGKPYTIEWNVKVMNVGKVSHESMATFIGYYHLENH